MKKHSNFDIRAQKAGQRFSFASSSSEEEKKQKSVSSLKNFFQGTVRKSNLKEETTAGKPEAPPPPPISEPQPPAEPVQSIESEVPSEKPNDGEDNEQVDQGKKNSSVDEDENQWDNPVLPPGATLNKNEARLEELKHLDIITKDAIREMFMFFLYLMVLNASVTFQNVASSAFLANAIRKIFVDTPFMILGNETEVPDTSPPDPTSLLPTDELIIPPPTFASKTTSSDDESGVLPGEASLESTTVKEGENGTKPNDEVTSPNPNPNAAQNGSSPSNRRMSIDPFLTSPSETSSTEPTPKSTIFDPFSDLTSEEVLTVESGVVTDSGIDERVKTKLVPLDISLTTPSDVEERALNVNKKKRETSMGIQPKNRLNRQASEGKGDVYKIARSFGRYKFCNFSGLYKPISTTEKNQTQRSIGGKQRRAVHTQPSRKVQDSMVNERMGLVNPRQSTVDDAGYAGEDKRGLLSEPMSMYHEKSLRTASNMQDFWDFVETTFLNNYFWDFWYSNDDPLAHTEKDDMILLYTTKLVGAPRIRQVRVTSFSCAIHWFVSTSFFNCYNYYTIVGEDIRNITPYRSVNVSQNAWRYTSEENTKNLGTSGLFSTYGGGGYYVDIPKTKPEAQRLISELKENLWISRGTRAVMIDFSAYNPNVNLFIIVKMLFEFPPTGGMSPLTKFEPLKFFRYMNLLDGVGLGCDFFTAIMMSYFTVMFIIGCKERGFAYINNFGNWFTLILVGFGWTVLFTGLWRYIKTESEVSKLLKSNPNTHLVFDGPRAVQTAFDKMVAILLYLSWLRAVFYIKYLPIMQPMHRAINRNKQMIVFTLLLFSGSILTMALPAYLAFGDQIANLSSWSIAVTNLIAAITGDFDYYELERVNLPFAVAFLLIYICMVYLIMVMIFAAVIIHAYSNARATLPSMRDRMVVTYLKILFVTIISCGLKKNTRRELTIRQIRSELQSYGFTDLQIDIYFAKYHIDTKKGIHPDEAIEMMTNLELREHQFQTITITPLKIHQLSYQVNKLKDNADTLVNDVNDSHDVLRRILRIEYERKILVDYEVAEKLRLEKAKKEEEKRKLEENKKREQELKEREMELAVGSDSVM